MSEQALSRLGDLAVRAFTPAQEDYIRALQHKLHLPNHVLDLHTMTRYGAPFVNLDRSQVSALIDEMKDWRTIPAELRRAMGQIDIPGLDGLT